MSHDPGRQKDSGKICTVHGDDTEPPEQQTKNKYQKSGSDESEFFADNRIDHVILGFGYEAQFLYTVSQSPSKKSTASNRIEPLDSLKSLFIFFRISPDCQTFKAIAFGSQKNGDESNAGTAKSKELEIMR